MKTTSSIRSRHCFKSSGDGFRGGKSNACIHISLPILVRRENSINNRWGYSVLPFFDFRTVAEALRIPIRYKHFGDFESAMIRRNGLISCRTQLKLRP